MFSFYENNLKSQHFSPLNLLMKETQSSTFNNSDMEVTLFRDEFKFTSKSILKFLILN